MSTSAGPVVTPPASPPATLSDAARAHLEQLYVELLPVVRAYTRNRLPEAEADDVAAEVFRVAAEHLQREPAARLVPAWILTVARSRVVDRWRHRARWTTRLHVLHRDAEEPVGHPREVVDRLLDALARLSPEHRSVLVLRYVDACSAREVAEILGRTPSAVDSLVARARRALGRVWEETT